MRKEIIQRINDLPKVGADNKLKLEGMVGDFPRFTESSVALLERTGSGENLRRKRVAILTKIKIDMGTVLHLVGRISEVDARQMFEDALKDIVDRQDLNLKNGGKINFERCQDMMGELKSTGQADLIINNSQGIMVIYDDKIYYYI